MKRGSSVADGREASGERGLSSVIGLVILIGVVAIAAVSILLVGGGQTAELQDRATGEQAETSMGQLRDSVGSLVQGTERRASAGFPTVDDEYVSVDDGSRIEVTVRGRAGQYHRNCTFESSMGSLRYRTSTGLLGYEGGGVFRLQDGASVVVQSPSVAYRTVELDGNPVNTLSVPVVDVTGGSGVTGDDVTLVRKPGASSSTLCGGPGEVPLDHVDNATVRVENSDFYEGWYDYFLEEFGDATKYDANRTVVARDVPLGQVEPGAEQSFGTLERTGELLEPYSDSSYSYRTVHEINWEVGTGSRTIETVRFDYENGSGIDLSHVGKEDLRVYYGSSINLDVTDPTHNRTDEIEDVRVEDGGTTLVVEFQDDLSGSGGGTGANAWFLAQYRNVRNPIWGGNYSVDIYVNGDSPSRVGELNVTGPEKPKPDADGDGIPDGIDECDGSSNVTGENGCEALSVVGDDDSLLVNQSAGEFVVIGSEFAVRNETDTGGATGQIEYLNATGAAEVNGSTVVLGSSTGLDPAGTVSDTVGHGVGSYLSVESTTHECDTWTDEGSITSPGGDTYRQVRCTSQSTVAGTYGNDTGTVHEIYIAGDADLDPPAGYGGNWYLDNVTELVEDYDPSLIDDGNFTLGKNEAVFVVGDGPENFSVVYYRAEDGNDDYYTDGVGPGGLAVTSNAFVVDVTATEVTVCDGSDSAGECADG